MLQTLTIIANIQSRQTFSVFIKVISGAILLFWLWSLTFCRCDVAFSVQVVSEQVSLARNKDSVLVAWYYWYLPSLTTARSFLLCLWVMVRPVGWPLIIIDQCCLPTVGAGAAAAAISSSPPFSPSALSCLPVTLSPWFSGGTLCYSSSSDLCSGEILQQMHIPRLCMHMYTVQFMLLGVPWRQPHLRSGLATLFSVGAIPLVTPY